MLNSVKMSDMHTCDGWTLVEGMMLGRCVKHRMDRFTQYVRSSPPTLNVNIRTLRVMAVSVGERLLCIQQTVSRTSPPTTASCLLLQWPTSSQKLPLTYTHYLW